MKSTNTMISLADIRTFVGEGIKILKRYYQILTIFAYIIYYLYLCTRKSEYCAGRGANNALINSDLAFENEVVEVPF